MKTKRSEDTQTDRMTRSDLLASLLILFCSFRDYVYGDNPSVVSHESKALNLSL